MLIHFFSFNLNSLTQAWSPELLVFGDLGVEVGINTMPALVEEALSGSYTALIHAGDFAYDFRSEDGQVGKFLDLINSRICLEIEIEIDRRTSRNMINC